MEGCFAFPLEAFLLGRYEKCSDVKPGDCRPHAEMSIQKVEQKKEKGGGKVNLQLMKLMKSGQLISISL